MSKFNTSKNKQSKIWELTEANRIEILKQIADRTAIDTSIKNINRVDLNLKTPLDLSFDFEALSVNLNPSGNPVPFEFYRNWQITFNEFDIRLLPFLKSSIIYRVGNHQPGPDEVPIDPVDFTEDSGVIEANNSKIMEVIQEFDIPNGGEFVKKIIYNKSLAVFTANARELTVKLNVTLMNPYIFI